MLVKGIAVFGLIFMVGSLGLVLILEIQRKRILRLRNGPETDISAISYWTAFIVSALILTLDTLLFILVVPKFALIFEQMGMPLPATTRVVVGTSAVLQATYFIPILLLFGLFIARRG